MHARSECNDPIVYDMDIRVPFAIRGLGVFEDYVRDRRRTVRDFENVRETKAFEDRSGCEDVCCVGILDVSRVLFDMERFEVSV